MRHVSKESFIFFGLRLDIIDDENMVYVSLDIGLRKEALASFTSDWLT